MGTTETATLVRIAGRASKVHASGAPGAPFTVDGGTFTVQPDGSIDVTPGTGAVHVTLPEHASLVVSTASGNVDVAGHVRDLRVITASGRVTVERVVDADVRTSSGAVRIDSCIGTCRVVTRSGTVTIGQAHDVGVTTASGKVRIGRATVAALHSSSGAITLGATNLARVRAVTMSGTVRVSVPAGTAATLRLQTVSGRVRNDLAEGEGAVIDVSTTSGAIEVTHE